MRIIGAEHAGRTGRSAADVPRIVVAADPTPAGWAALGWAESDLGTRQRGTRMTLCRTFAQGTGQPFTDIARLELFDPEFARQVQQVQRRFGGDRVDVQVRMGDSAAELIDASGPEDTIVLAAPPLGPARRAAAVAAHSRGTVVAVRPTTPPPDVTAGPLAGHVVVGVSDGITDAGAIAFAFDFADRHRQAVLVVHANEPDNDGVWADDDAEPHLLGHEFGLDLLDAAIDEARAAHPDVSVRRALLRDAAGAALVRASTGAHLLVVGDRGRSAAVRRLLGSVSRHVLRHARCTVAVVHGKRTG